MDDRITPRTAIKGFLDVASISKSVNIATRSRVRRSSIPSFSNTSRVETAKRKSQSFSEVTPRTLIQGVLATTEIAPDTARKRARITPPSKKIQKALTPGTVTRSARRRATRLDVLATPGGTNPTPRSLIQGLVNTAPVETPWNAPAIRRRSSPRNKPDFPNVVETLQSQAPGPSLSPFIKDAKSVDRLGARKLRSNRLRRGGTIDKEAFAAGIAEKLSQEEASAHSRSRNISILESFREEDENEAEQDSSISDAGEGDVREQMDKGTTAEDKDEEKDGDGGDQMEKAAMSAHSDDEEDADGGEQMEDGTTTEDKDDEAGDDKIQEEKEKESGDEQQIVGKDGLQTDEEEPPDPVFVRVSIDSADMKDEEEDDMEEEDNEMEEIPEDIPDDVNRSARSLSKDASTDEEQDTADQSTLIADKLSLNVSAGGDATARGDLEEILEEFPAAVEDPSTGEDASGETSTDDDDALMPTQAAPASLRKRGFSASKSMALNTLYINDTTMAQTMLDGYSPLVTPKLPAGRDRHKTPAPKKTPVASRTSVESRPESRPLAQANKKTTPKRTQKQQQQKAELNTLPAGLTKSIFAHFSKAKVSKDAMQAVMQGSHTFFKRLSDDLMAYATHAHRHTIEAADVELLMRRQHQITDKDSLHSLIEKYLAGEYRQELIPVARSGNKVTPKMGKI